MNPRFLAMIPFLWEWECVKNRRGEVISEDDPDDPGGLTKYGIDQRSHPKVAIRLLTESQAKEIYWREYWTANACDSYPKGLGEAHFNACVNCGAGRAKKFMFACGGSWQKYIDEQEAFYRRLAAARPSSKKFLKGWLNRTSALRKFLSK